MSTHDNERPGPGPAEALRDAQRRMSLAEIKIETDGGPWVTHNAPCSVFGDEHAVLDLNNGIFLPSWKAQGEGWRLVKADTRFRRWILHTLFKRTL